MSDGEQVHHVTARRTLVRLPAGDGMSEPIGVTKDRIEGKDVFASDEPVIVEGRGDERSECYLNDKPANQTRHR